MTTGTVFNIQHFTIHDGPGIRTELFLKGCPLRCRWCSNPEGLEAKIQPGVYRKKCLGAGPCDLCRKACPMMTESMSAGMLPVADAADTRQNAGAGAGRIEAGDADTPLLFSRGKIRSIDRTACTGCMACADSCPAEAIRSWGQEMTVEEAMREIRRDRGYYDRSGGGVTLSGGEPLLQPDFVQEVFQACRAEGIHTCLESCLHVPWTSLETVLPWTDLVIADIKLMDSAAHREHIGAGNEQILENLRRLAGRKDLILRIPVIPKVNDNQGNMTAVADFITEDLGGQVRSLQLLSYMRLGVEKYESLGMDYPMQGLRFQRPALQRRIQKFADYFNDRGIHCTVGTHEKDK